MKDKIRTFMMKGPADLSKLLFKRPERITAVDLLSLMKTSEKLTILDVRTPDEHFHGHIPGSVFSSPFNLEYMEDYSYEGKIILYCTAGVRSYMVSKTLAARGIEGVIDLVGGINAWVLAGGIVEPGV